MDRIGDAALIGGMTLYAWLMGAGHSAASIPASSTRSCQNRAARRLYAC